MDLTNTIQNLTYWFLSHGIKIISVFFGAIILNKFLKGFVQKSFEKQVNKTINGDGKRQRIKTVIDVFGDIVGFIVWVMAILMILSELGIETSPLLAGLGVIGLGFSFASKGVMQDFLRGFFVILEDQYRIGDFVKIADIEGVVEDLNPRTTILKSEDGSIHIIPNREIKIVSKINK